MVENDAKVLPNSIEWDALEKLPLFSIEVSYQTIQMDSRDDDQHTPFQYQEYDTYTSPT